jgi:hypothetical protein
LTEQLKPFQVLYDYADVPTIRRFAMDDTRIRCLMGPFGCISGDSYVITERGPVRISDIVQPTLVLTWREKYNRFELSRSGGAFPKGMDYLYRIVTQQGSFDAAGHHRVLCADNRYRQVESLAIGDVLSLCSLDLIQRSVSEDPLSLPSNALNFDQTIEDCMARYAESARQYGQQLLREANTDQVFAPAQDGVRKLSSPSSGVTDEHRDGHGEQLQEHIHQDQLSVQKQTGDFYSRALLRTKGDQGHVSTPLFSHILEIGRQFLQSLLMSVYHRTKKLSSACSHSYSSSSLSEGSILSIKRLDVKQSFWDMQVLGTNNYVTFDGTIHHNSGKSSGCVIEIFRRAQAQKPGPDGMRRSRWAVVRNSYGQLKDTTIKTFCDWFPPKIFGEYRVTDHTYIFTKLLQFGVSLEVLFRALDRPDQVSNLLSLEVTGAWFNEVREIPWSIIEAMDSRIGRYPSKRDGSPSWHGMIMDTNPPDDESDLYKIAEVKRPSNFKMFKQPSGLSAHAENTKNLPVKNYYQDLAKGKDAMFIRIYIHGQYGYLPLGASVFQSFSDSYHVAPNVLEPIKGLPIYIGMDFSIVGCLIGQLTAMGQLRILDELTSESLMGIRQFCLNRFLPLLRTKYFGMTVMGFGDMSGLNRTPTDESTCFDILHSNEIGLTGIEPAPTNALAARIDPVEHFLLKGWKGEPGLLISPNCKILRKAMNGGYYYERERKSNNPHENKLVPAKNYSSHIADALEYLCMFIVNREATDKQRKSFLAQLKQKRYNPASEVAGY